MTHLARKVCTLLRSLNFKLHAFADFHTSFTQTAEGLPPESIEGILTHKVSLFPWCFPLDLLQWSVLQASAWEHPWNFHGFGLHYFQGSNNVAFFCCSVQTSLKKLSQSISACCTSCQMHHMITILFRIAMLVAFLPKLNALCVSLVITWSFSHPISTSQAPLGNCIQLQSNLFRACFGCMNLAISATCELLSASTWVLYCVVANAILCHSFCNLVSWLIPHCAMSGATLSNSRRFTV